MAAQTDIGHGESTTRYPAPEATGTTGGLIHDNAKRSVSVRINTSDYGRIKVAARRLRTREADVFRYLLQVGLNRLAPLLEECLEASTYLRALAELGPALGAMLGLSAREFADLLHSLKHRTLPALDHEDFELIDLAAAHARLVLERLGASPGTDVHVALHAHLQRRYLPA
jgi:hypothetical protein